ncbi:MAG: DUF3800 domain-containing protein [Comamonadaceae bacterium]|nr:DUF3800 domain-containing protein [Comamonadaceae bacterium]
MFFYVDESGHTGANLFDEAQPTLFYGVLSSAVHLDYVAEPRLAALRRNLGVERLHAAQLGNGRLAQIAGELVDLQKRFRLRFDFYRVVKPDHAVICFFDQVLDQGMNPAVTWTGYWTPLRYILLIKVAALFDEQLARRAWAARINVNNDAADAELVAVCEELRTRLDRLPDARSRQLIGDALTWTIANPREIHYNVSDQAQVLQVTPNVIGFQSVMHGIAGRLRESGKTASRIIVDRQSQFNKAQRTLAEWYAAAAGMHLPMGPGMPGMNLQGMPTVPIEFKPGTESAGLELVDIYLWLFKRVYEQKEIARELGPMVTYQYNRGRTDEISLAAIEERWSRWERNLPQIEQMSPEQIAQGWELQLLQETRRLAAMQALPGGGAGQVAGA